MGLYKIARPEEIARPVLIPSEKRDNLSEVVVPLRTVVTFVSWLISRTEFSNSELVL